MKKSDVKRLAWTSFFLGELMIRFENLEQLLFSPNYCCFRGTQMFTWIDFANCLDSQRFYVSTAAF